MGRKKLKLQWIINDAARKSTYQKRAKSLLKKTMEISTLCGVDTCAIVNSPYDPQPEVWPPSLLEAARVLMEFKGRPDNHHIKKRFDQDNFLRQRITKATAQLSKHQKKNEAMEMENLVIHLLADERWLQSFITIENSCNFVWSIDKQIRAISQRMESLRLPASQPSDAPVGVFVGQPSSSTTAPAGFPTGFFMGQSSSFPAAFAGVFMGQSSSSANALAEVFMGQPSNSAAAPAGVFMGQSSSSVAVPAGVSQSRPQDIVGTSSDPGGQEFTFPSLDYRQILMNMPQQPQDIVGTSSDSGGQEFTFPSLDYRQILMNMPQQPQDIVGTSSNPGDQDFTFSSLDYRRILMNMNMNMPPQPQSQDIASTSSNPGGQDFTFPGLDHRCDQESSFWGSPNFP